MAEKDQPMRDLLRTPVDVACAAAFPAEVWRLEVPTTFPRSGGTANGVHVGVQSMPGATNVPSDPGPIVPSVSESTGDALNKKAGPKKRRRPQHCFVCGHELRVG